ncbi:MAG: adenosylmethionine--8-amino-7-oxononanoate transaminase [Rickettsiales bacterium]|jgi:adenosylmethionine-8-amino-7-oxononanoate aminotransferase|nr:adenosylmethionine--8-amino-7-oxononanoate transaminase [Rickettsiales bacterium]
MPMQPEWFEGLDHIWLPYTQMKIAPKPQAVVATDGCRIKLADGRELIDGIASWWSACHGYNHPHIVHAMQKQLEIMPHVMFGGLVHEPALTLAKRLSAMTGLPRVFFADSGSVAVEIALKMALQYWRIKGKPNKDRFLCFRDGYHGDTLGAMSVSDPQRSLHKAFQNSVIKQYVVDIPSDEYGFAEFDGLIGGVAGNVAGVIIEPLVQGAGGMRFHSADTLAEIYRICKKHGLIFIADEIATGFWRTGNFFACNEAGMTPDIMCLGKGLTGGAITLGATLASEEIYSAFLTDRFEDAFMHGPTYMGNPLACAAANASLDLFEREPRAAEVEAIEAQLSNELADCEGLAGVVDVRVKGAIGVVQIAPDRMDYYGLREMFIARGCWIRPFKDIIYLAPSFTISEEELSQLTGAIKEVLSAPLMR